MTAKIMTSMLAGINAIPVEVEVQVSRGLRKLRIIGLGDGAVRESASRVKAAIVSSGFSFPNGDILVNLAPADLKKEGSSFDISIAIGVLAASDQLPQEALKGISIHGELALDGTIKKINGVLARAILAKETGARGIVVPMENAEEAALIKGIRIIPVESLLELSEILQGRQEPQKVAISKAHKKEIRHEITLASIWGQEIPKRAALIAAAGSHNMLMIGPPGCGKSLLAKAFTTLLPPMSESEKLEVIRIYSAAGMNLTPLLMGYRPFRAPHHVISDVGLVGGGSIPNPGEITLAHRGVLFLDEFPEFQRSALEALRAPLEDGCVSIVRSAGSFTFPAQFQLIAAMNPCPCGRFTESGGKCRCSLHSIQRYLSKLSQPILDRIDIHVEMDAIPINTMLEVKEGHDGSIEQYKQWSKMVSKARKLQIERQGKLNAYLSGSEIKRYVLLNDSMKRILRKANEHFGLSARSYVKILKIARTIADLNNEEMVRPEHMCEALSLRGLERLLNYITRL